MQINAFPSIREIGLESGTNLPFSVAEVILPKLTFLILRAGLVSIEGELEVRNARELIEYAKEENVLSILSVENICSKAVHGLFMDEDRSLAFAERLVLESEMAGYGGVCLDFKKLFSFDRQLYSGFVTALAEALHVAGLYLFIALPPERETADAYDRALLGSAADRVFSCIVEKDAQAIPPEKLSAVLCDYALVSPGEQILPAASARALAKSVKTRNMNHLDFTDPLRRNCRVSGYGMESLALCGKLGISGVCIRSCGRYDRLLWQNIENHFSALKLI